MIEKVTTAIVDGLKGQPLLLVLMLLNLLFLGTIYLGVKHERESRDVMLKLLLTQCLPDDKKEEP